MVGEFLKNNLVTLTIAIASVLALVGVFVPTTVHAMDKPVGGTVEISGPRVWYSETYYHAVAGPIQFSFKGTNTGETCGGTHNISLRLQGASAQYTNTIVYSSGALKRTFTRTLNDITYMPAGTYQLIARNDSGAKCGYSSYSWYGTLHI